VKLEVLS
jgi:hypothetical protein